MTTRIADYPVPYAWMTSRSPRATRLMARTGLLALAFFVFAVLGWTHGEVYGCAVAGCAALGFVAEAAIFARTDALRRQRTPDLTRVRLASGATRVGQDRALRYRELASITLFAIASIGFTYGMWADLMTLPVSGEGFRTVYPVAGLVLGGLCLFEMNARWRRARRDFLVLSPDKISIIANNRLDEVTWESMDTTEVTSSAASRQAGTRVRYSTRTPAIRVDETCLGAPAVLWLMDFYRRHPELRAELAGARATLRLREGSLVEEAERFI